MQHLPEDTPKVHVACGPTCHGPTQPVFIMCGGLQQSPINNAHTRQPNQGVGAEEYVQIVLFLC